MQKSSTKLLCGVLISGLHYITYRQSSPFALWQACFFLWIWNWRLFLSFEGDNTEGSSPSWVDKNLRILNTRCLRMLKLRTWNVEEIHIGLHSMRWKTSNPGRVHFLEVEWLSQWNSENPTHKQAKIQRNQDSLYLKVQRWTGLKWSLFPTSLFLLGYETSNCLAWDG